MKKKRICLRGLADLLSKKELQNVLGGSEGGTPPWELDPVVISCGQYEGQCWRCDCEYQMNPPFFIPMKYTVPVWTGKMADWCIMDLPCYT